MKKLNLYQIDAFTDHLFGGNPACVVPLNKWLDDNILLKIAKENAVPETAFFVEREKNIHLRWFTPDLEMDLCGHATLAAAHCLKSHLNYSKEFIEFDTLSGTLRVSLDKEMYFLDFPSRPPRQTIFPESIKNALNIIPTEVLKARDFVLVYENEQQIREIKINRSVFDQINLDTGGVIVTSKGDNVDFVSRFFTPQATLLEDPVTGSAHCSLIPFWANRLQKKKMNALQLSERGGQLDCEAIGDRVRIGGRAKTYMQGHFFLDV
ncbi:MAG: PhzF family phenazine biosynthesis protein [Flavobacteriaceae bacterium]|nr:PhzF family phenazine biosynthesis protein [Flavobacteriaceae bacterium]